MKKIVCLAGTAFVVALLVLTAWAQAPETRRGITPEDYFAFEFLSDPSLSPDGKWVAYVVTTIDQRQNRRLSNIWLVPVDGSQPPRQLTNRPQSSNSPLGPPRGQYRAFLPSPPAGTESSAPTTARPAASPSPTASPTQAPTPEPTPLTPTTPGISSALSTTSTAETPRTQVYLLP